MEIASKTLASLIKNLIPNSGYTNIQSKWIMDELQALLIFCLIINQKKLCILACSEVVTRPNQN